ncbi:MAG: outer membrane lipoprotein carrier protein LolA [Candidatus Thiodiazotropha lotti]|nr:outer membrane lipoprotein carrier protein LolA [Candidatus Thiodiazotropha lotti]MCG7982817.1 outer membrane lipoprotein carrier protein LolA [Candidatus Thiodiazotropha lotti]MCG7989146.1 outer membrane lipoprotein carrier protein LolA [Candidatus Thiodiazotropha lotti]MCG8005345.1 outer membrane lipoprotein carrier protein LolA [Candidatus Thiodiazotropha lotti]MCG8009865.1 outer membrane lipoprotein carrier protein LolA [Candidatus Thiodiazotropha lotti]
MPLNRSGITFLSLVLLLFSLSLPAAAEEPHWSLDYLMTQWQASGERQARFTETRQLALLDQPIEQQGTLLFQPPDRLVRTLAPPSSTKYEIEGNRLTLWRNQQQQVVLLDNIPELLAFSASFRSVLSGDRETLERYFNPELTGSQDAWSLNLIPREGALGNKITRIEITGTDLQIERYLVIESNGDQIITQLMPIGE